MLPTTTKKADEPTAAQLLRDASRSIRKAIALLDMREHACGECKTRHFDNTTQARIYKQFQDAPHKLTVAATFLEEQALATKKQQQANQQNAPSSAKEQ